MNNYVKSHDKHLERKISLMCNIAKYPPNPVNFVGPDTTTPNNYINIFVNRVGVEVGIDNKYFKKADFNQFSEQLRHAFKDDFLEIYADLSLTNLKQESTILI